MALVFKGRVDHDPHGPPYNIFDGSIQPPCDGCTRCCRGDTLRILPHEDPAQWRTRPHPTMPGALALEVNGDGNCVYLTGSGCSIHGSAPQQCRTMDCRNLAAALTWSQSRKLSTRVRLVWEKGRDLNRHALKGVA